MDAKGTGTFEESYQLVNLIGGLLEGWSHEAVKMALTANLGEVLARECKSFEQGEQQVGALAEYMANAIVRKLGTPPLTSKRGTH